METAVEVDSAVAEMETAVEVDSAVAEAGCT